MKYKKVRGVHVPVDSYHKRVRAQNTGLRHELMRLDDEINYPRTSLDTIERDPSWTSPCSNALDELRVNVTEGRR